VTAQASEGRPLAAAAWMTGAIVSLTLMAVAGRGAAADHDTFEILLYRSLISIVLVLALAAPAGTLRQITTRNLGTHLLRNLSHFAGQSLWFWALTLIPLAHLFALEFTSPIWTALLAALILGEPLTRLRLFAVGLGFAGVLIIVHPDPRALEIGALAAAASAIGFAGSAVFTRKLTRTESITCILFWLAAMQAVMGLVAAGWDGAIRAPSLAALPWLALIAVVGLTAHFCLTTALRLAPAAVVMPMDFARLPAIAVIGMIWYGEALDLWIVLGAAVILAANWLNIRGARPARPAPAP
jgi:drug/metabolite transporter (DMT)-like permease